MGYGLGILSLVIIAIYFLFNEEEKSSIITEINGEKMDYISVEKKNEVFVPARKTFEKLGMEVLWDESNKTIKAVKEDQEIELRAGVKSYKWNGKEKQFQMAPENIEKTLYVPVYEVAKLFGISVTYHENKLAINAEKVMPKLTNNYDVVVVGTDPEGVAAAIAASREGQKTLLVDTRSQIGGLFTLGELNSLDMSYTPGNERLLTKGLFEEFFNGIDKRTSFDIDQARDVLEEMLYSESNITVELSVKEIEPIISGNKVTGVKYISSQGVEQSIAGKQFIDATQDADFAAKAGVVFTFGQEDYRGTRDTMCVTLVFELSGAKWDEIVKYLKEDGNQGTGADAHSAWGYAEMYNYRSTDPDVRMRGLNIGKRDNGNILINALQVLNVDGTDKTSLEAARSKAEKELPLIVKEMRKLPGLTEVKLERVAPEMYVRETRHMKGIYRVTLDDVLENRDFPDKIAFGSYPVDVQKSKNSPDIVVGNPQQYSIPFRAIVPNEFSNLLVASRSASYDSLAHGSIRVVPVGMAVAEAAGVSAAYSNSTGVSFAEIAKDKSFEHITKIQKTLNQKNAQLDTIPNYKVPVMDSWAYEGVKFIRKYAIIAPGYENDYALKDKSTKSKFVKQLEAANKLSKTNKKIEWTFNTYNDSHISKSELLEFIKINKLTLDSFGSKLQENIQNEESITNEIAYQFIFEFLKK